MPEGAAAVIDDASAAFVEAAQPALMVVDIPQPIIDGFEAKILLQHGMADRHAVARPANAAVAAHPPDFEVAGVFGAGGARRIGPRRGAAERRRRLLAERLVRPVFVLRLPPAVKPGLLGPARRGGGARGVVLQGAVHPFVPRILLGVSGLDELGRDAEPDPPGR